MQVRTQILSAVLAGACAVSSGVMGGGVIGGMNVYAAEPPATAVDSVPGEFIIERLDVNQNSVTVTYNDTGTDVDVATHLAITFTGWGRVVDWKDPAAITNTDNGMNYLYNRPTMESGSARLLSGQTEVITNTKMVDSLRNDGGSQLYYVLTTTLQGNEDVVRKITGVADYRKCMMYFTGGVECVREISPYNEVVYAPYKNGVAMEVEWEAGDGVPLTTDTGEGDGGETGGGETGGEGGDEGGNEGGETGGETGGGNNNENEGGGSENQSGENQGTGSESGVSDTGGSNDSANNGAGSGDTGGDSADNSGSSSDVATGAQPAVDNASGADDYWSGTSDSAAGNDAAMAATEAIAASYLGDGGVVAEALRMEEAGTTEEAAGEAEASEQASEEGDDSGNTEVAVPTLSDDVAVAGKNWLWWVLVPLAVAGVGLGTWWILPLFRKRKGDEDEA